MGRMVNIGIIGCGYWGPNYIRIISELSGCHLLSCCDLDSSNLSKIKKSYSHVHLCNNYKDLAGDSRIDAVIITTPHNTHFDIAKLCLKNGKHVLIEKPFTSNYRQAEKLVNMADNRKLVLMVGHVYRYNPAVIKLKEIIDSGKLGNIYYITAERFGLGPVRKYANALWDLTIHDISTAIYLLGGMPNDVFAIGEYYIQDNIKDLVFLSMRFPSRIIYNAYSTWIAPEKIRKTTIVGSKGMAVLDDVNKQEPLKIYERAINKALLDSTPEYTDHQLVVNIGDTYIPKITQSEPLKNQVEHFLGSISKGKTPLTCGRDGLRVVSILEAAEKSLKTGRHIKCR